MPKRIDLPETGFVRLPSILAILPISKSSWWQGCREGRFPKPVKIGPRITAWSVESHPRAYPPPSFL
jgi:predicted DNA-binding transcriptional regulator AlpA